VADLVADPDFRPRKGQSKKSAAFVVCQAGIKGDKESVGEAGKATGFEVVEGPNGDFEAVWSTAVVNDLPDSAFAAISPGGKKDSSGKTTPRSLRHLPHHGPSGAIDKPHLRNALSRLSQTNISSSLKSKANAHLKRHMGTQTKEAAGTVTPLAFLPIAEAKGKAFTGAEWKVRIINAGVSRNQREYPLEVLHRDKDIFEGTVVHAAFGPDHSGAERGVKSVIGLIKDVQAVPEGLDGTLHISDPTLRATLLDLHSEDVLDDVMGLSIAAEGEWESSGHGNGRVERAVRLTDSESVDLVREPAAGGKFIDVTESDKGADKKEGADNMGETETLTADDVKKIVGEEMGGKFTALETQIKDALAAKDVPDDDPDADAVAKAKAKKAKAKADADAKAKSEGSEDGDSDADDDNGSVTLSSDDVASLKASTSQINNLLLAQTLEASDLPPHSRERILESFKGDVFDATKVNEAIGLEKDYLAKHEKVVIENITETKGTVTKDEGDKLLARLDAMFEVVEPRKEVEGEKVKPFRSFREAYAIWNGLNPYDISADELAGGWLEGMSGYNSGKGRAVEALYTEALQTSNLAEVTADRMHKALIHNYANMPQYDSWRKIVKVVSVADYIAHRQIKFGGYGDLSVVAEKGVYNALTHPGDEETTVTMEKRGGIADQITRELILNDSVGAISEIPKELALAAKRTLNAQVWAVLTGNATYGVDSTAIFDATHSNTGTTALSISGISLARIAMRDQTRALATDNILGQTNLPKFLAVPNELEGLGQRLVNPSEAYHYNSTADTDADDDPHRFKGAMELLVLDIFTDATEYFFIADPMLNYGIIVAFLDGNEEPSLYVQAEQTAPEMFSMDVQNIKIRHEYQEAIVDYRPFYRQT
tara:strand:- start:661 stop:3309 length:2649 start_codon:yes stop_codon:yes gene_type:complete